MKALIVLENHFYKDINDNIWCDRIINYNFLKRYLNVFEGIVVAGRCQKINTIPNNKLLVSGQSVSFVELPEFIGARGLLKNLFCIKKILRKAIDDTDCTIYRAPTHISLFTYKEVTKKGKALALEFMMAADKMVEGNGLIKKRLNHYIKHKAKKMCLDANGVSYVTNEILQREYPCKALLSGESKHFFTASYSTIDLSEEDFYEQKWGKKPPKKFRIIHTGYMDSYRKGQDVLIKAIKLVREKNINIELVFIGDGEKRIEFENLVEQLQIEDVVKFKGLIKDKKDVLKELRQSHLLVFPTQSEGLPRTIIEAMAQGLPCISSPVDGIPELLDDDCLVDSVDVNGYANKIIEFLSDWNRMRERSKENYLQSQKYSRNHLNVIRNTFYQKICNISGGNYEKK